MRIYTYFNEDGSVCSVHLLDDEKIKEAEEKAKEYNKNLGREAYKIFTIPEGMEETITYLMGEKKYKRYADLDDVDDTMNELSASINSLHDDAWDMAQAMERLEKEFAEVKKQFKNA